MAFIDLAGFGLFNTTHGQARGDDVIGAFGRALGRASRAAGRSAMAATDFIVHRDARATSGLYDRLEVFRAA